MSNLDQKHILVVEDEDSLCDLYVDILKEGGYNVSCAKDGEEAYKAIKNNDFDLIMLDIILPKIDGLQVLQKLEEEKIFLRDKVVILSNLGQDAVVSKALTYGVRGYLLKTNYTPDQVLKEIKNFLND